MCLVDSWTDCQALMPHAYSGLQCVCSVFAESASCAGLEGPELQ